MPPPSAAAKRASLSRRGRRNLRKVSRKPQSKFSARSRALKSGAGRLPKRDLNSIAFSRRLISASTPATPSLSSIRGKTLSRSRRIPPEARLRKWPGCPILTTGNLHSWRNPPPRNSRAIPRFQRNLVFTCGLALYNGITRSPQGIRGWRIDAAKSGGGTVLSTTSKYHSPDMAAELAKDGVWMEKGAALANLGAPSSAVFEARKGSSALLEFDLQKAGNALADHFAKAASVFAGNGKWAMAEYAAGNGYMANTWGDSALVRGAMENRAEPPSVPPAFPAFGAGARMCAYYHADAGRFFAAATANIPGAGKNRSFSEGASSGAAWIAPDGFHAFMRMDFGAAKCFMQARDVFAPGLFSQPMPPPSALLQPEEDDID